MHHGQIETNNDGEMLAMIIGMAIIISTFVLFVHAMSLLLIDDNFCFHLNDYFSLSPLPPLSVFVCLCACLLVCLFGRVCYSCCLYLKEGICCDGELGM